ncbi:MAG: alpha/beta hydrolase [Rhodobacteraceae bacterium]|nr:alpha/beta hydrolase [Paracoccaceae bacterium]MAY46291.1 alpha/beta hydrolase [Paracoccaceae bacterium]QEW23460.1 Putative aminoacrylate hydrolase RutD [Paracoccaceae bacterium]
MPTLHTNGITTHYEIRGSGPVVLFASGLNGIGSYWAPQVAELSRHFTVVTYDQRGAGQTDSPDEPYSIDLLAHDLKALILGLGLDRPVLVGHSTGGAIGQVLATDAPDLLGGLLLYASWPKSDAHFNWCFRMRSDILERSSMENYLLGSAVFLYPPEYVRDNADRLETGILSASQGYPPANIVQRRIDAIVQHDAVALLPDIAVPTLVLCAQDDVLTPPYHSRAMAKTIPGAELCLVDSGGHGLSETRPDFFNDIVTRFVKGLASKPADATGAFT